MISTKLTGKKLIVIIYALNILLFLNRFGYQFISVMEAFILIFIFVILIPCQDLAEYSSI